MAGGDPEEILKKIFRLFDVNSDGSISKKEMKRLVKDMYGLLKKEDPNLSAADLVANTAFAEGLLPTTTPANLRRSVPQPVVCSWMCTVHRSHLWRGDDPNEATTRHLQRRTCLSPGQESCSGFCIFNSNDVAGSSTKG